MAIWVCKVTSSKWFFKAFTSAVTVYLMSVSIWKILIEPNVSEKLNNRKFSVKLKRSPVVIVDDGRREISLKILFLVLMISYYEGEKRAGKTTIACTNVLSSNCTDVVYKILVRFLENCFVSIPPSNTSNYSITVHRIFESP